MLKMELEKQKKSLSFAFMFWHQYAKNENGKATEQSCLFFFLQIPFIMFPFEARHDPEVKAKISK